MFQAASISKPVAALAALSLVEEEKMDLDSNINNYLLGWQVPDNRFTVTEKATLRRLVSHNAGLTVHGFRGYARGEEVPTAVQVLDGEAPANSDAILPDTLPGAIYRYSGGGYTVMQKAMEDITGKSFPAIMQDRVLSVIGMENSTYEQPLPANLAGQVARGFRADGLMVEGEWHTYPEMAAAGLWTTPTDLSKYAIEVQRSLAGESNKVISRDMTEEMLTAQINGHGLGPGVFNKGDSLAFAHGGANEGFRCTLVARARLGEGVVVMTNSDNGGALIGEIMRSIDKSFGWGQYTTLEKSVIDINYEKLQGYAGKYVYTEMPLYTIEITLSDGKLLIKNLWDQAEYNIYPESETQFFQLESMDRFDFVIEGEQVLALLYNTGTRLVKIQE
jgi:CubicO group peptidase (beta-lactamase class C family)